MEVLDDSAPVARYRYDGLNRRIRKLTDIVEDGEDSECTVTEYYYNSSWQVLEERREAEVSIWDTDHFIEPAVASDVYCQYVWTQEYIDTPLFRDRNADGDSETSLFGVSASGLEERICYTTDANHNVTALTHWGGAVRERYMYDPYGRVTVLHGESGVYGDLDIGEESEWDPDGDGTDWDNEILYCGYRYDPETGLYHVRRRVYDPLTGRWLQRDPVASANLYEGAAGNPLAYTDPLGLWARVHGSDTVYCAQRSDTLRGLAREVSGSEEDWPCIWPTPDTTNSGYPQVLPGDKYDVSNLVKESQCNLSILMLVSKRCINFLKKDRPFAAKPVNGSEVYDAIKSKSREGATPITHYEIAGHSQATQPTLSAFGRLDKVKSGMFCKSASP